ncbi:MAG TPA: hypothetical protein VGO67_06210 [Verrucomicrobiae bacterium]
MSSVESCRKQIKPQMDIVVLLLMSIAAPWFAAFIHSVWVFHRGFRFYNAEFGGKYFFGVIYGHGSEMPNFRDDVIGWTLACVIPGAITFLILLPFRRLVWVHRILWVICIALWTLIFFKSEVAMK